MCWKGRKDRYPDWCLRGRMTASREAVPPFSLWKPLAPVCLLPSKHVNCTLLKMWQWHQPLGWPLTIGNTYSPGLHFRYELWTSIALSAWRACSPQARLQRPDSCVSPPLWSQPAAPGLGPQLQLKQGTSSLEIFNWGIQKAEVRLPPSRGGNYCRSCFWKARLQLQREKQR